MTDPLYDLANCDDTERPVALATLLRLALDGAAERWRQTPYGRQLLSRFTPDEEGAAASAPEPEDRADPDPANPFCAWHLSWRALQTDLALAALRTLACVGCPR